MSRSTKSDRVENAGFGCVLLTSLIFLLFYIALFGSIIFLIIKIAMGDVF